MVRSTNESKKSKKHSSNEHLALKRSASTERSVESKAGNFSYIISIAVPNILRFRSRLGLYSHNSSFLYGDVV